MTVGRRRILGGGLAALAAVFTAPARTAAQHGTPLHGVGRGGHAAATACEAESRQVIAEGRGFGMAFAADQNGYPGPMHVLELKADLALTAEQEARVRELHARVMAERGRSTRLLEAERRLERLFASGTATEDAVRAAVAEIERARTDVRLVHVLAHLETRDLLTPAQRDIYHRARWSGRP